VSPASAGPLFGNAPRNIGGPIRSYSRAFCGTIEVLEPSLSAVHVLVSQLAAADAKPPWLTVTHVHLRWGYPVRINGRSGLNSSLVSQAEITEGTTWPAQTAGQLGVLCGIADWDSSSGCCSHQETTLHAP
jgi:hypothetical protein